MEDEAKTHDVVSFKSKEWQCRAMAKENLASVPQQNNGIDCGVFVCMYAEYLLFDLPLNFSRTDIFFSALEFAQIFYSRVSIIV